MKENLLSSELKVKLYFCFAVQDKKYLQSIEKHIVLLKKSGLIESWDRRELLAGNEIDQIVESKIENADIILLLISPDFFNTDYIYNYEMEVALERHNNNLSIVIPVYLRSVDYSDSPISKFQILPNKEKPISSKFWNNEDEAVLEVIKGLKEKIYEIKNRKIKNESLKRNSELITKRNSETDDKEKEKLNKKLSKLMVEQYVIVPFDNKISYHPIIASRAEPSFASWEFEKVESTYLPNLRKYNRFSGFKPYLVLLNSFNNEPYTLYIKYYCIAEIYFKDGDLCKRGEVLGVIKVPLLRILQNQELQENHWSYSRGDSGFAGALAFQPDLRFWQSSLKLRFRGLDKKYGCLKISSQTSGIISINENYLKLGSKVNQDTLMAKIKDKNGESVSRSPVNGFVSSWAVENNELVHQNETLCHIRTHPPLLMVEVDYSDNWMETYVCRSPISGIYISHVPIVQKKVVLIPGKEIEEKSIVCGVKNNNLLVAVYVHETVGKILQVYKTHGDKLTIGDPIFKIKPKYLFIRSPIVGTFYRQKEPQKPPFIRVGDNVSSGQVVCLVEAMKLNNEIESEISGKVVEILVEDATPVRYDQALFKIQIYD